MKSVHSCGELIELDEIEFTEAPDKYAGSVKMGDCPECGESVVLVPSETKARKTYAPCPKCGSDKMITQRRPGGEVPVKCTSCGFTLERRNWPRVEKS